MYNDNVMTMKGAEEDDMKEDVGSTAQCSGGENEDDKMPGGCFFFATSRTFTAGFYIFINSVHKTCTNQKQGHLMLQAVNS